MNKETLVSLLWGGAFVLSTLLCARDNMAGAGYSLVLLVITGILLWRQKDFVFGPGLFVVFVFGAGLLCRALISPVSELAHADAALILAGALSCLAGCFLAKSRSASVTLLIAFTGMVVLQAIVAMVHKHHDVSWLPFYQERVNVEQINGLYGHRNYLGNQLASLASFFFAIFLFSQQRIWKWIAGFVGVGTLYFIVLSGSRGAVLAFGLAALFVLSVYLYGKWLDNQLKAKNIGVAGALVCTVACATVFGFQSVAENRGLSNIFFGQGREGVAKVAVEQIIDKPLWGGGARSFHWRSIEFWPSDLWKGNGDLNFAHNEFLQLLTDYGFILGGLTIVCFFGVLATAVWRFSEVKVEQRALYGGAFGVVAVTIVQSSVSFPLHFLPNLMLFMLCVGILIGLGRHKKSGVLWIRLFSATLLLGFVCTATIFSWSFMKLHPLKIERDKAERSLVGKVSAQREYAHAGSSFSEYRNLGDLYFSEAFENPEKFEKFMGLSLEAYQSANKLHPFDLSIKVALGVSHDYLGQFDLAEQQLLEVASKARMRERYLRTHRKLGQHYFAKGLQFYHSRKTEEAYACMLKADEYLKLTNKLYLCRDDESWKEEVKRVKEYLSFFKRTKVVPANL